MEYVCSDPNAQVRETFVLLIHKALSNIPTLGRKIIEEHQLPVREISEENFIPLQRTLDMLKQVKAELGPIVVRQAGSFVVETAEFPPVFDSVEKALLALDGIYRMHHRGDVGSYDASAQADGSIVIRGLTPYPREFVRGLVDGICKHPRLAQGQRFLVTSADGPEGGELTCTITIRRA